MFILEGKNQKLLMKSWNNLILKMIVCNIDESTVFKNSMLELNSIQKFVYIFHGPHDHYFLLRHLANKHNK